MKNGKKNELIRQVCKENELEMLVGHVGADHIHLLVFVLPYLTASMGSQTVLIDQEDILYICSQRNCVRAVTMKGSHTWRCTLDAVTKQLVTEWFVRIHRQTLCAISYIADIDWGEGVVNMRNGDRLVLSRRLAPQLRELLSETVGIHR